MESPLEVLDPEHETHLLAKGNPEGGPEDPRNAPVIAAILRNPNRKQNAESPSLDRAARSPDLAHLRLNILVFTDCSLIGGEGERRKETESSVALFPQSGQGLGGAALQVLHPDDRAGGVGIRHLEAPDARTGCAGARSRMQPVGRQAVQGAKRPRLQTSAEGRNVEFGWDYSATLVSLAF